MDVNRLAQDELTYEMECRGLSVGTVDEMRKSLRGARLLERRGSLGAPANYPFSFEQDKEAIEGKLLEILKLLENAPKSRKTKEYLKVLAKVEWGIARLDRAQPDEGEEEKVRIALKNKLLMLLADLEEGVTAEEEEDQPSTDGLKASAVGPAPTTSMEKLSAPGSAEAESRGFATTPSTSEGVAKVADPSRENSGRENSFREDVRVDRVVLNPDRFENLSKWDVKFTGERCGASVNAFLERVEEIRQARGVTVTQLFRSAVELFVGKALLWFRAVRVSIHSWDELVKELKLEFLPPNYDDLLLGST